jgi:DNA-binding NtrC family response regulator
MTLGRTLTRGSDRPGRQKGAAATPHLFLAIQTDRPLAPPARFSLAGLDEVVLGRGGALEARRDEVDGRARLSIRIPDAWMSGTHARLIARQGQWLFEDANSKNGTVRNGVAEPRGVLSDGDLLELGHAFLIYREALPAFADDAADLLAPRAAPAPGLATLLPGLQRELRLVEEVARSTVSVLIHGPSGTGKEVVARAVHALSGRGGALVAANCGAIPANLVEAELFGHKKGAFSGATEDRAGLVRSADRGTLLLDEIGDLPLVAQAALLRVLQEREVVPVGGTRPIPVDLRVVAATHRDLREHVSRGLFRDDLHARLNGFVVRLPPLRERREDLGLLIAALLPRVAAGGAERVSFTSAAARALFAYRWPQNVRELEKCLGAAVVLAGGGEIDLEHLPETLRESPAAAVEPEPDDAPLSEEEMRHRDRIVALLEEHDGNIAAVAREFGKARMQVHRWLKRYRIERPGTRR